MSRHKHPTAASGGRGFTMAELLVSLAVILITLAAALPNFLNAVGTYRMMGDARTIASQVALARVRATADFTQAQLNFSLANGTYQLQRWDKATSAFDITEGGTQSLSTGVTFSLGGVGTPAGTQTTIQQTPQIVFNSRGTPANGGNYAIYLKSAAGQVSAVTVSPSGKTNLWRWNGSTWKPY
jgi:prepilin-type N-terminal cleavage/methylation domain-containing protein